ncbi:hypothetical protein SNE40_016095 [Patella caerulea]|uniref:Uncharacterized protein n=1 Tax=Patella caerulea TaxID=87958 RepID=A0AAN8JC83_PATCE
MSIVQEYCVAPGFNPDRVLPAVSNEYFAVPMTRTSIGVWSFDKLELRHKPLELHGHRKTITALAFGNRPATNVLCSCAGDYVIVWDIEVSQRNFNERKQIKGEIIGTSIGEINHCVFNADDTLVAVCVDVDVYILKSNTQTVLAVLDGHLNRVTGAEFCPHYSSTIVTISDDRTFKIWDLHSHSLVYQSCVITSSALVNICMNWDEPAFSVGSADGIVRTYDLTDGNDFRTLFQLDINSIKRKIKEASFKSQITGVRNGPKTISSRQTWKRSDGIIPANDNTGFMDRCEESIVGLCYAYPQGHREDSGVPSFLRSAVTDMLNKTAAVLLVATTSTLLQIDPKSLETLNSVDLQMEIPSKGNFASRGITLGALDFVSFNSGHNVWAVAGTLLENRIHVLNWPLVACANTPLEEETLNIESAMDLLSLHPDLNPNRERVTRSCELSMVATNPLCKNSPLSSKLTPISREKARSSSVNRRNSTPAAKKYDSMNQPITFKNKVKSSGYSTQAPKGKLFQPQTGKIRQPTLKRSQSLEAPLQLEDYPVNCGHPNEQISTRSVCETSAPITSLRFSGNGQNVASGLANKLAISFPLSTKKMGSTYQGHDAAVNSVYWSRDNSMIITASDDKSAIVWTCNPRETIMKISTTLDNFSDSDSATKKTNPLFPKEVKQSQFYYMDKFILLISGNGFYMYKYYLDTSKHEIRRYLTKSKYKLVKSWFLDSQCLTAMAAVNSFHSHISICAGSNRSYEVVDMNEGRSVSLVTDAHVRPIHAIALNEGSTYVSQPDAAYNVFATAAVADCIKLWDLRTNKCVQRFEGHVNKAIPCGLAISPCGQYLASGSEDKLTYLFDVRTGTYCDRLRGHSDVVSTVAFHPAKPLLASGSIDGNVVLYKPENWHS